MQILTSCHNAPPPSEHSALVTNQLSQGQLPKFECRLTQLVSFGKKAISKYT